MATTTTKGYPASTVEQSTLPPTARPDAPPSSTVNPTRSHTVPQRAATVPNEGTRVTDSAQQTTASPTSATGRVPWKDQVIAYAKKTRGKVLRKVCPAPRWERTLISLTPIQPTLKEHGDQILAGEANKASFQGRVFGDFPRED
ncbi:hypothetical protein BJV78DRAFT_1156095 [Lactifluus subvellereus]|nr:hypothetical protein BJV78DRAFT_1156095 [Lactifluus subvellereus]